MKEAICQKHISDGTFQGHTCGRPVAGEFNGEQLCKRHINVAKKRAAKREEADAAYDKSRAAEQRVELLAQELGVDITALYVPSYSTRGIGHYSDTQVVISIDELKRLVGR